MKCVPGVRDLGGVEGGGDFLRGLYATFRGGYRVWGVRLKGYGLDTMRMHQLRGQVVCLRQKKTTGASSGKGTTRVLRSLPTLTSSPTSSMMSSACAGPYSSLWPGPAEDEETLPSGAGHSSLVMAAQPKSERQVGSERETEVRGRSTPLHGPLGVDSELKLKKKTKQTTLPHRAQLPAPTRRSRVNQCQQSLMIHSAPI